MKVRIVVATWPDGTWRCTASSSMHDGTKMKESALRATHNDKPQFHWIEAELPDYQLPIVPSVSAAPGAGPS